MTDRELLEKAAKAVGRQVKNCYGVDADDNFRCIFVRRDKRSRYEPWNPLTNDGDALRLAVKLGIQPHYSDFTGNAYVRWGRGEKTDAVYGPDDPYAATRRAIVMAAAAIGEAMP